MKKIILILLLLSILLRIGGLGDALYQDESIWGYTIRDFSSYEDSTKFIPHPPLAIWMFRLINAPFEVNEFSMRLVPFLFGVLNIFLVYRLGKEFFGKKQATIAALLMGFSFWHYVASLQVDMEGSILTCLFIVTFWAYLKYTKTNDNKWLMYTALLFTVAMFTKITSLLILVIIGIHSLIVRKDFKKSVKEVFKIGILGIALFGLFYLGLMSFQPGIHENVFGHASDAVYSGGSIFSLLPIVYFVLWGTALYVFLLLYSFFRYKKEYLFYYIWIILPIVFYFFVGRSFIATYDRYLMITIPALALLGGNVISEFSFEKKDYYLGALLLGLSFIGSLVLNGFGERVVHNIGSYFSMVMGLQWNFLFPISSSTGPVIVINFMTIAIGFILSGILILLSFRVKQYKNEFFIVFLGIALGLNIFMINEMISPITQPDVSEVMYDMFEYIEDNQIQEPYVTNVFASSFYLNWITRGVESDAIHYAVTDDQADFVINHVVDQKGSILFLDYPLLDKESYIWEKMNSCELKHEFISKDIKMGYLFQC
tara:strand:- start:6096 stop:7718 length:1623 start_codon:yes stop_codon:yes gene_type:complete